MRLAVCDPHRMLVDALAGALRDLGHDVAACCSHPADLPALALRGGAEACLVESHHRGRSRIPAVADVRRTCPDLTLVLLTAVASREVWHAFDTGVVDGVVSKSSPLAVVDRSVRAAGSGQRLVTGFRRTPAGPAEPAPPAWPVEPLTARELQVLGLLADGVRTGTMAERLAVSPHTVRTHVATIYRKLGVHDRGKATSSAIRGGLL